MNYRQQTYILLNGKAVEKLTPETTKILYGEKAEHVTLTDGSKAFTAQWLTYEEDKAVTEWLDTLDGDKGEVFEVIACGDGIDEIEHFSNTLAADRLSVEFQVKVDDVALDDVALNEAVSEKGERQ